MSLGYGAINNLTNVTRQEMDQAPVWMSQRLFKRQAKEFTQFAHRLRSAYQSATKNRSTVIPDQFIPYGLFSPYKDVCSDHRITAILVKLVAASSMRAPSALIDYPLVFGQSQDETDRKVDEYIRRAWSSFLESFYLLMRLRSTSLNPGNHDSYKQQMLLFNSNVSIRND